MRDRDSAKGRRRLGHAFTLTVTVGISALVAVGLANGAALTQKSVSFAVPGDDDAHRVAKCKPGQEAVAGGFRTEIEPFVSLAFPAESFREGKRKWLLRAQSTAPGDSTATVYAYCDNEKPRLDAPAKTASLDPAAGEVQRVTQPCPPASEVVGGGFASDFEGDAVPVSSKRVGRRGWQVGFVPNDDSEDDVTVYAYCDARRPSLKTKTKSGEGKPGLFTSTSVKAKCGHGQRLRSGGFDISYSEDAGERAYPTESRRAGKRRWKFGGFTFAGNPTLTAYAYCDAGKSK